MPHHSFACRLPLPTFAAAASAAFHLSTAAQPADPPAQLPGVVVTGSNLSRVDTATDSPLQVITRADIARTGARTVKELIDTLASATGALSDLNGSASFSPGASGASLRNLGKQSTLVLLNFRRIAPNALADYSEVFTNLDSLPLGVVDRIEVLKNGAAAIYGSDAVAGVINIITRNDFHGIDLQASREQSITSGRLGSSTAALTGGVGTLAGDGYNLMGNVEVYHRDPLMWSQVLGRVNPDLVAFGAPNGFGSTSTYSYPGNVQQADGSLAAVAGCPASQTVGGLCRYDRYQRYQAVPQSDRVSLFSAGKLALGRGMTGFAEVNYAHIRTGYESPYAVYGPDAGSSAWGDPRTLQPKLFTAYGLPAGHPLNPSGQNNADFRYRFVDAPADTRVDSDQYRLLAGVSGQWRAWDWESALGTMGSRTRSAYRGALSDAGFKANVGDYTQLGADGAPADPNFFNHAYRIGQPNSAAVVDSIFPTFGFSGRYDQRSVDAKATRSLIDLPAGAVRLAVGAELRHETYTITPTDNLAIGDIVGYGTSATDASRSFGAGYAELRVPVLSTLEMSLAARYDKYPGFAGNLSPKLGLRWQPAAALLFRGTVETGFRAPNLVESAHSTKFAFNGGISDPSRCPQASALSQALAAQAANLPDTDPAKSLLQARAEQVQTNECSASVSSVVTNNPNLQPEKSRSFTFGIVLEPVKGATASIDYWNIRRSQEIGLLDINKLLVDEGHLPQGDTVTRRAASAQDPTFTTAELLQYGVTQTALASTQQSFVNTAKTKTSGIDIGLKTDWPLGSGWGRFGLIADAAYLIDYSAFGGSLGAYGDNLAGRYGYPRLKLNLTGIWNIGPTETSLRLNYSSATALQADYDDVTYTVQGCADNFGLNASECRVAAHTTFDLAMAYTGIRHLTIGLGIKNLLGSKPPADRRAFIESGGFIIPQDVGDVSGRMLRVALEWAF